MTTSRICVIGSANADLTVRTPQLPAPGQTVSGGPLQVLPGGKSANQATAAGRLGGAVTFIGAVGNDDHGQMLLDNLRASGVDTTFVCRRRDASTGTAVVAVDQHGENFIIVSDGANGLIGAQDVDAASATIEQATIIGLSFEIPMAANIRASEIARAHGATVVLNPSPFTTPPPELLRNVDVLVVNEHEMHQLMPDLSQEAPLEQLAAHLAEAGIDRAVVTLGADGAALLSSGTNDRDPSVVRIAPTAVETVDTTGCGDAFTGALLHGIADGLDLEQSAREASSVGAFAATRVGAQSSYPHRAELEEFVRQLEGGRSAERGLSMI